MVGAVLERRLVLGQPVLMQTAHAVGGLLGILLMAFSGAILVGSWPTGWLRRERPRFPARLAAVGLGLFGVGLALGTFLNSIRSSEALLIFGLWSVGAAVVLLALALEFLSRSRASP